MKRQPGTIESLPQSRSFVLLHRTTRQYTTPGTTGGVIIFNERGKKYFHLARAVNGENIGPIKEGFEGIPGCPRLAIQKKTERMPSLHTRNNLARTNHWDQSKVGLGHKNAPRSTENSTVTPKNRKKATQIVLGLSTQRPTRRASNSNPPPPDGTRRIYLHRIATSPASGPPQKRSNSR